MREIDRGTLRGREAQSNTTHRERRERREERERNNIQRKIAKTKRGGKEMMKKKGG